MTASAHVTFSDGTHSQTYVITAATTADVDAEVERTKTRLQAEWGTTVTVTYLPS